MKRVRDKIKDSDGDIEHDTDEDPSEIVPERDSILIRRKEGLVRGIERNLGRDRYYRPILIWRLVGWEVSARDNFEGSRMNPSAFRWSGRRQRIRGGTNT